MYACEYCTWVLTCQAGAAKKVLEIPTIFQRCQMVMAAGTLGDDGILTVEWYIR